MNCAGDDFHGLRAGACIFSYRRLFKGPEAGEAKPLVTAGGAPARRP